LECARASSAVNLLSRLEALAKSMEQIAVCSRQVTVFFLSNPIKPLGDFVLQHLPIKQKIFSLALPHTHFGE
jgi:hypothetical protein